MNDLQIAVRIGFGAYETPNDVLNAIAPQLNALVTDRADRAAEAAHNKSKGEVIMYSAIAAGVGIVGGGLLGLALARRFRR